MAEPIVIDGVKYMPCWAAEMHPPCPRPAWGPDGFCSEACREHAIKDGEWDPVRRVAVYREEAGG